jgi:hypothetical protein
VSAKGNHEDRKTQSVSATRFDGVGLHGRPIERTPRVAATSRAGVQGRLVVAIVESAAAALRRAVEPAGASAPASALSLSDSCVPHVLRALRGENVIPMAA